MGGRVAAVEQTGRSERKRADADRGDARASLGGSPQGGEADRRGIVERKEAGNDHRVRERDRVQDRR